MGGYREDPILPYEDLLRLRPFERYELQRVVEREFGYDPQGSFTVRCPRCRNNSQYVYDCKRCNRVGIVGVVTVKPDQGYL